MNALELTEELQARTDLSERDARGIVYAISRAVEAATAKLVTSDQFEARLTDLRAELKIEMAQLRAELRTEIATVRVEMHQAIRAQTIWLASTMIGTAGIIVAAIKLIP